jgi:UDP-N-acetylglucosamine diphosphorylase/glucosamine-1-phosphate N-acetyltransferase
MDPIILDDHPYSASLFPFAETRSVADIRIGILTIREKWARVLGHSISTTSEPGISQLSAVHRLVPANIVPSSKWIKDYVAGKMTLDELTDPSMTTALLHPWHIFQHNALAIRNDFELVTEGRVSAPVPASVGVINEADIFIEDGAILNHCTLNASSGPVYIGSNTEIMEGANIRGPFALCEGSVVKMGAKIYGATTIGPNSVVGGELKNVVIFGHSNKAHDGYLGDAVLGEWCNLGAGTSASNVKNNAGSVKVWNNAAGGFSAAGNKCGLMMGDYSRAAINTSFNTGTVVGICANIFSSGLVPTFVPSFTWGSAGVGSYSFDKALEHIGNWKKFKNQELTNTEIQRLKHIFDALSSNNT